MPQQKYLIVIGGPTAAGKTALAIRLARRYRTEILSADSRQFFRELNIGVARPDPEELAAAPHHFIAHRSIEASYSVGDYERDALAAIHRLFQQYDLLFLVGGSGLYLKAVCEGLDVFPEVPGSVRDAVQEKYEAEGLAALQAELQDCDPDYYEEVDRQNPARLMRALGVCRVSGRPFSSFRNRQPAPRSFVPVYLQVRLPRPVLYDRINRRVDAMLAAGLEAEARRLHPRRGLTALETVGYQELFDHFEGRYSREDAVRLIKRNTRRYAKRQLTWLRRDGHWKSVAPGEAEVAASYVDWRRRGEGPLRRVPPYPASPEWPTSPLAKHPAQYLTATTTAGSVVLPFLTDKKWTLYLPPWTDRGVLPGEGLSFLLHEAVITAAGPTYAIFPPRAELFAEKAGFHTVTGETLPGEIETLRRELALPLFLL